MRVPKVVEARGRHTRWRPGPGLPRWGTMDRRGDPCPLIWLVFGAEFKRRWRSWLALALMIALVGGLVLAAAAAGRRTATAFPRFVATHGYDAGVFSYQPLPALARLPEVASIVTMANPANGQPTCACTHPINSTTDSFGVVVPAAADLPRMVKLTAATCPTSPRRSRFWPPSPCSATRACTWAP